MGNILAATHRYIKELGAKLHQKFYLIRHKLARVKDKHDCLAYKQRPMFGLYYCQYYNEPAIYNWDQS